jgi:hypothetical protein
VGAGFSVIGMTVACFLGPMSEKRPGTKSREITHRRCDGIYGDLSAARRPEAARGASGSDARRQLSLPIGMLELFKWGLVDRQDRPVEGRKATIGQASPLPEASRNVQGQTMMSLTTVSIMTCPS